MWLPDKTRASIWIGALFCAAAITVPGHLVMAQGGNESSNLLVNPATANGTSPAQLKLDFAKVAIPPQPQLELSVEPLKVSNERYIVVVATADGQKKHLGSFTFYPPPRKGDVQRFLIDAGPLTAGMSSSSSQKELSVRLVPVDGDKSVTNSELRILGARLVGG
jgi:hypothetical protein